MALSGPLGKEMWKFSFATSRWKHYFLQILIILGWSRGYSLVFLWDVGGEAAQFGVVTLHFFFSFFLTLNSYHGFYYCASLLDATRMLLNVC